MSLLIAYFSFYISCILRCSDEEMWELLKAKRNADSHFRKVKLQYEGPKNPWRSNKAAAEKKKEAGAAESKEEAPSSGKKGSKENEVNTTNEDSGEKNEAGGKFKPTATKKQFVSDALGASLLAL